jgi:hypothetical protein
MASHPTTSGILRVPADADLDTWTGRAWRDGVQIDELAPLERLRVKTRNTPYEITVLNPQTGDVLIRGGRFFPLETRARVNGASLGGSFLKMRGIYVGFSLEITLDDDTVITSPVERVEHVEDQNRPS